MYAPRPQTHQISRHYTTTTTIKRTQQRDKDKENANAGLPTKTPSRAALGAGKMLAPNTTARVGLGAAGTQRGKGDVKGKGKEGMMEDIAPKRLFTSSKSYSSLNQSTRTPARGLLQSNTVIPPATLAQQTPLPSASKPRRSSRRSTSASLTPAPTQAPAPTPGPVYQTPAPKTWDEGNSLDSISEGLNELALNSGPAPVLEEVVEEEEDGEPEYMPPHDEPLPYEPVGAVPSVEAEIRLIDQMPPLWSMASVWRYAQAPPSPELEPPVPLDLYVLSYDEDELEEPMFRKPKPKAPASAVSAPTPGRPVKPATTTTTNKRPIPTTRLVRPPPPPTKHTTGSSRITKPPVPRLAPRPAPPPARAPVPPLDFDRGIMGETSPLFLNDDLSDLNLDFELEDAQVQTP